jgi:uncharacterized Fe-S cluster protein YjdI
MQSGEKHYSNGEVTITWKPELCSHSTRCWKHTGGLPQVFNPKERPWIKPEGADTAAIIAQVKQCPSGALGYFMNDADTEMPAASPEHSETHVTVSSRGPLLISGNLVIKDPEGKEIMRCNSAALCRCGASSRKPFCDGSHNGIGFED